MSRLPDRYVVDTNVPIVANLATGHNENNDIPLECINACVELIGHVCEDGGLLIDDTGEIFIEYSGSLSFKGAPGQGDKFLKWVHDHQWDLDKVTRIPIHGSNGAYEEFPDHDGLKNFDRSDRKFVAVACACPPPHKPPVFQATDSKWLGWKDALREVGIKVRFLCPEYIKEKYTKKFDR